MNADSRRRITRLVWATDVHLNFVAPGGVAAFAQAIARQDADAAVITGDIAEAPSVEQKLAAVSAKVQKPIFFVLGNHDYYRSSLAKVREGMKALSGRSAWLRWLPASGVVELTPDAALVGVDGWADGRLGDYDASTVMLNDYLFIEELAGLTKSARRQRLQELADAEAQRLSELLSEALSRYRWVVVATHVPPFKEACWHEGRISNDAWLPHFSCHATGEVLRRAAQAWPQSTITVLCGHTHGAGIATILPNLTVVTGGAEYGEPRVQGVLDVSGGPGGCASKTT